MVGNLQRVVDLLYCALEELGGCDVGWVTRGAEWGPKMSWEASAGIHEEFGEGEGERREEAGRDGSPFLGHLLGVGT